MSATTQQHSMEGGPQGQQQPRRTSFFFRGGPWRNRFSIFLAIRNRNAGDTKNPSPAENPTADEAVEPFKGHARANRFRASFRSSSESTTASTTAESLVVASMESADSNSTGFREVNVAATSTASNDVFDEPTKRPTSQRGFPGSPLQRLSSRRLRRASHRQSCGSSVPFTGEEDDQDVEEAFRLSSPNAQEPPRRLVKHYSLEREGSNSRLRREQSNSSIGGTRESRSTSEISLSLFSPLSSTGSSSPRLLQRDGSKRISAGSLQTALKGLSAGMRMPSKSNINARRASVKADCNDETMQSALLKVQFVSLVNDLQAAVDGGGDTLIRATKADRISRLFLQQDSIFFLKDLPDHFYSVEVAPMEETYLEAVLIHIKDCLIEELVKHESIETIINECSRW